MLRHWIAAAAALVPAAAGAQPIDWTGFYIGVNGALSRDRERAAGDLQITQISGLFVNGRGIVIVPGTTRSFAASGRTDYLLGGAQLGYRWQTGNFVFGGEADFDPFHRDVTAFLGQVLPPTALTPSATIGAQRDVRIDREFSVRARAGIAFGHTLAYATGGYANARVGVNSFDVFSNPGGPAAPCTPACQANLGPEGPVLTTARERHAMGGWTAGGGVDQAIGSHFSIGLEARHTDLGSRDFALTSRTTTNLGPETHGDNGGTGTLGSVSAGPTRVSLRNDAISLRLNFRF
jgi:opacity protein-like surface antigen